MRFQDAWSLTTKGYFGDALRLSPNGIETYAPSSDLLTWAPLGSRYHHYLAYQE